MKPESVALLIYGNANSNRDALLEEKFRDLALAFINNGFHVKSVLYNDEQADSVYKILLDFNAILVWVNPVEQGVGRKKLDVMLIELSSKGCFVSTHPEIILKIGTKDVLYKTKDIGWTGEVNMYSSYEDFVTRFPGSLENAGSKILKQYRGNGGNGVFKIAKCRPEDELSIVHAKNSTDERTLSWTELFKEFKSFFTNDGLLIEQEWNNHLANGMVRCYLSGSKVAGFGYQEINALYELKTDGFVMRPPPGKRYYFTQNCGLFNDLKQIMEREWVPQLKKAQSISDEMLPVIWDADFFINQANSNEPSTKYSLCEINVSCVAPFPPSAIPFIVKETSSRLN